jgi:hypothetical protein
MAENKNRGDTNVKQKKPNKKSKKLRSRLRLCNRKKTASKRGSRIQSYEAQAQAQTQPRGLHKRSKIRANYKNTTKVLKSRGLKFVTQKGYK